MEKLNKNGFLKLSPKDKAPEVKYNAITEFPDRVHAYSAEQKARKRRSKNYRS